jgi:hypothetical protein
MPSDLEQMAGTIAALSLGGGAYVQRQLERRLRLPHGPVPTPAGYEKPWLLLLVGSIAIIWFAESLGPFVSLRGGPLLTAVLLSVSSFLTLIAPAAALVVGVVIAQRSDRWPLAVTLVAVVAAWILQGVTYTLLIGFATGTPPPPGVDMPPIPTGTDDPRDLVSYLLSSELPLLIGAAMLGHWYGTRTRLQAYLGGLLREVAPDDREAIVAIAYDAARSRGANKGQRSSGS